MSYLSEYEYQALMLSLKVAGFAILWLIPIGIGLAWLLAKKQFVGKSIVESIVHLPLVLPPVVIGYLLLVMMGRQGVIGSWLNDVFGIVFSFSWKGAALACVVVALPLMVRSIRLSLETVDSKLEEAAATLGASPLRVFFTITLPLMIPGIITGTMLSFARSLGEFGATITFVSNIPGQTRTLPSAIYAFLQVPGGEGAALRLVMISIALAMGALILSEILARRMSGGGRS